MQDKEQSAPNLLAAHKKRWLLLGGLTLFEYLLISTLFDSQPLRAVDGWWSNIGFLGRIAPLFFLAATAAMLLRGQRLLDRIHTMPDAPIDRKQLVTALALHSLSFVAFLGLSYVIFTQAAVWETHPQRWFIPWLATGICAAGSLWPAFFPRAWSGEILRHLSGAIALGLLVGLIAWQAGLLTEGLWTTLQHATLSMVAVLLKAIVGDIVLIRAEAQVGTPGFWVTVAPVCSGYEGIGLITVFIAAYIIAFRKGLRFPQVFLLFPLSIAIAFTGNAVRITALILVGAWVSPEVALGGFHSKAGWIFFSAIALGIVYLSNRSSFFSKHATQPERNAQSNPTAAYLMPQLVLIATAMISGMFLPGSFNYLYACWIPTVSITLWVNRRYFADALHDIKSNPLIRHLNLPAIATGVVVFILWVLLEPKPEGLTLLESQQDLAALSPLTRFGWIAARIVGSVLLVPLVEELTFRGYLLRKLIKSDFTTVSYKSFTLLSFVLSSLAFGLLHQRYFAGTLAGMAYAGILYRRGNLRDPILAHAVTNGLIAIWVLGFGRWEFWL